MGNMEKFAFLLIAEKLVAVVLVYVLLFASAIILARNIPKTQNSRNRATLIVVGLGIATPFIIFKGSNLAWQYKLDRQDAQVEEAFQEKCKKAGETIYKTVENIDGVLFVSPRTGIIIKYFHNNKKNILSYRYVDHLDTDNVRYRYAWKAQKEREKSPFLNKVPASGTAPRYGVIYNQSGEEYEILGISFKIIDFETNEIIAEKTSYELFWHPRSQSRSANRFDKCPSDPTWEFFVKVLKPSPLPSCNVRSSITGEHRFYISEKAGRYRFPRRWNFINMGTSPLMVTFYDGTITDGNGKVAREQVTDFQPYWLPPGKEEYFFSHDAAIGTPTGSMRGTFTMLTEDGACEVEFPETPLQEFTR